MSVVTNLIITTSTLEDTKYLTEQLQKHLVDDKPFIIASVDSEDLPKAWYGGSKY